MERDRLLIVASIAIGTALLACMLSSTYAVLIDPLPFPEANRIVTVSTVQDGSRLSSSFPDYEDLSRAGGPLHHGIYVASVFGAHVEIDGHPEMAQALRFEGDIVSVFQKPPILGDPRDLTSARNRDTAGAVISYQAWTNFFGKDPQALGKTVRVGPSVYAVRAILPPEYQLASPADVWIAAPLQKVSHRDNRDGKIYARLAPGVSLDAASAWLTTIAESLQKENPKTNEGTTFEAKLMRDSLAGESKLLLYLLACGAGIVLCVAYFNAYQLLAAKASLSSSRWAIRIALGAGRKRLFQDILKEPLLLSVAGCALGLLLSIVGIHALRELSPPEIPRVGETQLVWQVVSASFVLSTGAAALFALLMFIRTISVESHVLAALRGGAQHGTSLRHSLRIKRQAMLVAQIALSTSLLIFAAMVALALRKAVDSPLGFSPDGVSVMDLDLSQSADTDRGSQYLRDLLRRVAGIHGVKEVAAASSAPFEGASSTAAFTAAGPTRGTGKELQFAAVSSEFFHTLKTTVLRGRSFSDSDGTDATKVAILNQAAARALFGTDECLLEELKADIGSAGSTMEVVGVVEDIRQDPTTIVAPAIVYLPLAQVDTRNVSLLVRADAPIESAEIRSQIWALNGDQAVPTATKLSDLIDSSLRRIRYMAMLMTLFAATTMLLSALGVYAAVAHWLSSSQKEIAVCVALGASYGGIRNGILVRVLALTGVSLGMGLLAALAASNTLAAFLYGARPQPGLAFLWATLLLGVTALGSSYVPSLRSRFIDPAQLLRSE